MWTLGLVFVGVVGTLAWWAGEVRSKAADRDMRRRLADQAKQITHVLKPELVRQLTFTQADKGTPTFEFLRKQLMKYGEDLPCRGIFTMARRDERIHFGPESYKDGDSLASPPGTVYKEPPAEALAVFSNKRAVTIGPYVDEFGEFVTALAPLIDPATGEVLLVVGVDHLPDQWQAVVAATRRRPIVSFLVTVALLIGCGIAYLRSSQKNLAANLRFRAAIITPVALAMLAGGAAWISHERELHDDECRRDTYRLLNEADTFWRYQVAARAQILKGHLNHLTRDVHIRDAWLDRDMEALVARSQVVFDEMKYQFGITHFYFVEADRTCLLRVHQPERHGDKITRISMLTAQRSRADSWGLELGPLGSFTLRYVRPCVDNTGEIVGFIELGMEVEDLVNDLAENLGVDLVSLVRKRATTQKAFEAGKEIFGFAGRWQEFENVAIAHHTLQALPEPLIARLEEGHFRDTEASFRISDGDRQFDCGWLHLRDASGSDVADLILLNDATERVDAARHNLLFGVGLGIVVLGAVLILLWSIASRVESQLDTLFVGLRERVKELTCLQKIRHELQQEAPFEQVCERIAVHLVRGMQFPDIASVVIEFQGKQITDGGGIRQSTHRLHANIESTGTRQGSLSVFYLSDKPFIFPKSEIWSMRLATFWGVTLSVCEPKSNFERMKLACEPSLILLTTPF